MPRLSSPFEELEGHYEAVVVGSGYGAGVAAARLARAGYRVCVFERGREIHPGEYPSSLSDISKAFQIRAGRKRIGSETSLFDFRVDDEISVLVGCGLGGTSLINANVSLEPKSWVLSQPEWPQELRNDVGTEVAAGIARARAMLTPGPYPDHFPPLQKLDVLEEEATALGGVMTRPDLTVSFETGPNPVGVEQVECRLCGDCVSGCNHGSKNTTLMNYLPYARKHGARIFTEIRVDWLERNDDGWLVHFRRVGTGEDVFEGPHRFVRADIVVLGAGTLGSTEILLRSRERGLSGSDEIGRRFSGNGDVFSFGYNYDDPVNAIGLGEERLDDHEPVGPCIAGLIDQRDADPPERGFVIEDGSPPGAIAKTLPAFLELHRWAGARLRRSRTTYTRRLWRRLMSLPIRPYEGALHNTLIHLVMTHDSASGELRLEGDRLRVSWPNAGREKVFEHVDRQLALAAGAMRGTHIRQPLWDKLWQRPLRKLWYRLSGRFRTPTGDRDLVTVHPLGGCTMASDAAKGVVNHKHQVFSEGSGSKVHESLYVCDAAVMPRSLGVNPLLTISALAERACHYLLEDRGRKLLSDFPICAFPAEHARPRTLGLRFSERMTGWVTRPESAEGHALDHFESEAAGRRSGSSVEVILTIATEDLAHMLDDEDHMARVCGVATAPALFDGAAMIVAGSTFQLFTPDPERINTRNMLYDLQLVTSAGGRFRIRGVKYVKDHSGFDLLRDTTTLFTQVYDENGVECARGVIRVGLRDFLKQMRTLKPLRANSRLEGWGARLRFLRFFAAVMVESFGRSLATPNRVDPTAPRTTRKLRAPNPKVVPFKAHDGLELRLTRYQAGDKGPVILAHGLGVSSRIFTIDTIDTNLLEYLCERGYDVWLLDFRASIELPHACFDQFSADDVARFDYPAAIDKVLEETGADDVQMIVHCYGATTFFMSVLGGHVNPGKVRSVVASQIATNMITSVDTRFKAGLYAGNWLYWLGFRYLNTYTDTRVGSASRLFDFLLRFLPLAKKERCRSDVCHRISFTYSLLYEHDRLDPATHEALHEMFGVANLTALRHLAEMSRQAKVVDSEGRDVYMPHLAERRQFPIRFIHGAENDCFKPESTRVTLKLLEDAQAAAPENEPRYHYDRVEIPGYGHIDCIFGKDAAKDVYPKILEHLERPETDPA
jgi:cholesterol oxidase